MMQHLSDHEFPLPGLNVNVQLETLLVLPRSPWVVRAPWNSSDWEPPLFVEVHVRSLLVTVVGLGGACTTRTTSAITAPIVPNKPYLNISSPSPEHMRSNQVCRKMGGLRRSDLVTVPVRSSWGMVADVELSAHTQ